MVRQGEYPKVRNTLRMDKNLIEEIKRVSKKKKITQVSIYEKGAKMYLEHLKKSC